MKIVFDSEWEKTRVMCGYCPEDIGLINTYNDNQCVDDLDICTKCWEAATTIEVAEEMEK